jgi:hypothetical protein
MADGLISVPMITELMTEMTDLAIRCGAPDWFAESLRDKALKQVGTGHVFDVGPLLAAAKNMDGLVREPLPDEDDSNHRRYRALRSVLEQDLELMETAWTLVALRSRGT